jgi:hemoglobin/transferrin/lactoferrin receptor protein
MKTDHCQPHRGKSCPRQEIDPRPPDARRWGQVLAQALPAFLPEPTMKYTPSFILLAGLAQLQAQNLLDPLLVTAERTPGQSGDAPYTTAFIEAAFIREQARRTLPEALQYTPGVLVQKTANGHGSPFIRGFTGRQNLLLMDGVRINNSTFRSGPIQYWNTIDPLSLDHLELVKSQGSVLYGSDAIGGTLNAFGKSAGFRDQTAGAVFGGGQASYEFRSNGQGSHQGRLELETGIGGCFGVLLGTSLKDFGDIEDDAVGRMRNTGYPEQDYDLRLDWAATADSTVTFASYYVNQDDISRWHRTLANPGWKDGSHVTVPGKWTTNNFDQERSLAYLRYAGTNPRANAAIHRWSATVSYQASDDSEFQNRLPDPAAGSRPIRGSAIAVETMGVDLELESRVGPGGLVYGFDFYHDDVDSSGYQTNARNSNRRESLPVADDSTYDTFGLFSQYIWQATGDFELTAGARYTHVDADVGRFYDATNTERFGQSQDWDAAVGSLRGIYHLDPAWSIYGGLAQSFRAPNLDDLSGNMTAKSGGDALGNANLDPERYLTYELGLRQQLESLSWGVAAFYTDATDMMVSVPLTPGNSTTIATNASEGYVYGFELEGAWRFHPQWELSGFAAWQDGRNESPEYVGGPVLDKPNARQLPLSGSLALRWTAASRKYWLEGRILAADLEDRITAADQAADNQRIPTGGTPGYVVASLRGGWTVNDCLDLTAGLENLTDESYRSHGSGQNEPGFGGIIGARVKW